METTGKLLFTKSGYEDTQERLRQTELELKEVQSQAQDNRKGITSHLSFDNNTIEQQIALLSSRALAYTSALQKAMIVQKDHNCDCVQICSKVYLTRDGKEEIWLVRGHDEGYPQEKKIAYNSPFGKVLMGRKVGDTFQFRDFKIKILKIE